MHRGFRLSRSFVAAAAILLAFGRPSPASATLIALDVFAETPRSSTSSSYVFVRVTNLEENRPVSGVVSLETDKPGFSGTSENPAPRAFTDITYTNVSTFVFGVGPLSPDTYVFTARYAPGRNASPNPAIGTATVQVYDARFPIPATTSVSLNPKPSAGKSALKIVLGSGPTSPTGPVTLFDLDSGTLLGDVFTKDGVGTIDLPPLPPGPHQILVASSSGGSVVNVEVPAPVPEPPTRALLAGGIVFAAGLAQIRRRRGPVARR